MEDLFRHFQVDALTDHGDESVRKQVKQILVFEWNILLYWLLTLFSYMKLQLQIELDSEEQRRGIFVIGATNRYTFGSSSLFYDYLFYFTSCCIYSVFHFLGLRWSTVLSYVRVDLAIILIFLFQAHRRPCLNIESSCNAQGSSCKAYGKSCKV
jgi:hypothetical protein